MLTPCGICGAYATFEVRAPGVLLRLCEFHRRLYDNNGSFNTRLANTRLFGLLMGPSSAITTTDRLRAILHPDYPAAGARARLEAFESVPLFKAVLDQYHGQQLPDETGMRNALMTRWEITEDKVQMVASRLMESADQAGLFKTSGNRTRMIRPTLSDGGASAPPAAHLDNGGDGQGGGGNDSRGRGKLGDVRENKMIDGVLDMLPAEQKWDEANLSHWLRFFEDALRLYYRLPKTPPGMSSNGTAAAAVVAEGGGR